VALDGPDRDVQGVRDLRVRPVVADRGEHLGLARRDLHLSLPGHRTMMADPGPGSALDQR
jgi:hypothetical protein